MRKYSVLQKVMALALTLVLVVGLLPNITLPAAAAEGDAGLTVPQGGKVADPETLNNWTAYYGEDSALPNGGTGISTWKAGGVWTDKSVFADADTFNAAAFDENATNTPNITVGTNNFLVSLSALASNQEIVGQNTVPTDTILVLDVSGSMDDDSKAEAMVEAANRAIHTLLQQNKNNRIGVVLYSGTNANAGANDSTILLPLDHYTTTSTVTTGSWYNRETIPAYLSITNDYESPDVYIASGVRNSNNLKPTAAEREVVGATYIQSGLYTAAGMFQAVTDTVIPAGNAQAGTQRTPVMILMSDGRPTLATVDYDNVGLRTEGYGNGQTNSTSYQTVFLTQLTAAWAKGVVAEHYSTDVKFYSLGMATKNDSYATAVLNPAGINNSNLNTWWANFQDATKKSQDGTSVTVQSGSGQRTWTLKYSEYADEIGKNYVDRYWSADNVSQMISAFMDIVNDIQVQTAYSATLVESDNADLSGYITVEDELGSMMEVKNVKGILLGNTLFTGAEMAKSLNTDTMGSFNAPSDYGNQFVRTVMERIGTATTSETQQLIGDAYNAGQLSYTSDTVYSNYIGWYGDADNNYLGFWQESEGYDGVGAPEGAKYINKSYGYLGAVSTDADAADMMHIVVMVHTEIATGHQTVLFKIPSSLIPLITYKVTMEGDSLVAGTECTLTVTETDPIRLLYEVGLPDDVNSVNLEQKVQEYKTKTGGHVHTDDEGNYVFYANSWGHPQGITKDTVISELEDAKKQALTASVAESHFIPNTQNERFYVLEDSTLYTYNDTSKKYTEVPAGTELNPNTTYYFARTIVTVTNKTTGAAVASTQYEALYSSTVKNGDNFQDNTTTGYKEVKAGTIRQHLSQLELLKSENTTETIHSSDSLWVYVPAAGAANYNIYSFLGNNGKLTVAPAAGIKVTKNVTEYAGDDTAETKFAITVTLSQAEENAVVTDAEGNALPAGAWSTTDNKVFTLNLVNGQTAYITGLTAGTTYTVEEVSNDVSKNYTASYTYENAEKKVVAGKVEDVTVTNAPLVAGGLYITKEVKHATAGETFPTDEEFEFKVTFKDADGKPIANTEFAVDNNYDPTLTKLKTDANGVITGKLKHGETAYIQGIPAGAVVTVEELNVPAYYTDVTYRSRNITGGTAVDSDDKGEVTIVSGADATVVVTNTYDPASASVNVDVTAHKTLKTDAPLTSDVTLKFAVEKWNPEKKDWDSVKSLDGTWKKDEITQGTDTKDFEIGTVALGEFTKTGTYTFRVVEVEPSPATPGMAYDKTVHTIIVTVTDNGKGQLVATVTNENGNALTDTDNDSVLDFTANFTNVFDVAPVSIEIVKAVDNQSNTSGLSKEGFQFAAYEANADWTLKDETADYTVTSDSNGSARLTATYNAEGVHYYVVKELSGSKPGWTAYSDAQYRVTVTVTKDADNNLAATMSIVKVDTTPDGDETVTVSGNSGKIIFKNTYDPKDAEVPVDATALVKKTLEGRELKAGEFTFALFKNGEAELDKDGKVTNLNQAYATATNDKDGNVYFGTDKKLTFAKVGTYEFDVIEVKGDNAGMTYDPTIYDLVIEVTDKGDGTLVANYYFEDSTALQVSFKNTYTLKDTEAVVQGTKTLNVDKDSQKTMSAGDYTFGLYAADSEGKATGDPLWTTTNHADGSFAFAPIPYEAKDAGKTFTYVLQEIAPEGAVNGVYQGTTYSDMAVTVTVKVIDNGDGTMKTEVSYSKTANFVNSYVSSSTSASFSGKKTMEGRDLTAADKFTFVLYKADASFAYTEADKVAETTNGSDGTFTLSTGELKTLGYHYYVLKEQIPAEEDRATGIGYDTTEYHITVNVVDLGRGAKSTLISIVQDGNPNASFTATSQLPFKNTYTPVDGSHTISGSKTYNGGKTLEGNDFEFGLYEVIDGVESTTALQTTKNTAAGTFSFQEITYTAADVGKTYTYVVREIIPTNAAATENSTKTVTNADGSKLVYDAAAFTVKVTVADKGDGTLEITQTVNDSASTAIAFTNTFVPAPIQYELTAKKTYEKGVDKETFEFTLKSADDKTSVNQTKTNDAEGNIKFDAFTLPAAGEYKFSVKEKEDTGISFISWSKAVYDVTIMVENVAGELKVTDVSSVNNESDETGLEFINTYLLEGQDQVVLSGTKYIDGDRTTVNKDAFTFGLYNAEGKLVEAVKNDENGSFAFTALSFDQDDITMNGSKDFVYTVKEIPGEDPYITYDETVYTVTITVKDDDEGGVDASYVITKGTETVNAITFTNTYTAPDPVTVMIDVTKTVENKTQPGITAADFEIQLYEGDTLRTTAKTGATGKAGFQITYDVEDVGKSATYKVVEKKGKVAGVTYDETVHIIKVTVAAKEDGSLYTIINDAQADAVSVAFKNIYEKPATPVTGDNFPVILVGGLLLISAAAIVVLLLTKKQRKGGKYAR